MNGEQIRIIRGSCRLAQSEFGEALGVGGSFVSSWERGEKPIPRRHAARVLKIFHVDPASLLPDQQPTETHARVIRGLRLLSDKDAALVGYVVECQLFQIVCEPQTKPRPFKK